MAAERPSFPAIYITLARALAARSTCGVDPVGAVITSVDFRKVLAIGYRGNASGLPNVCDHAGPDCGCLHAEENAVIHCDAPRTEPKIAFSTALPCRACAKRLINLGGVQDLYLPVTPEDLLAEQVRKLTDADGSVIDLLGSVGIRVHTVS